MIEVTVFAQLSNGFVVIYGGTKYIISNDNIAFIDGKAYTYPDKLRERY